MGRTGPKPIPTAIKKKKGTAKNSRLLPDEYAPPPISNLPKPPDHFNEYAKREYHYVGEKLLADKLLVDIDLSTFIMYCTEMGIYYEAQECLKKDGRVFKIKRTGYMQPHPMVSIGNTALKNAMSIGVNFGITPSARTKISGPSKAKENKLGKLIAITGKSKTA